MTDWANHIENYAAFVRNDSADKKYMFLEKCKNVDNKLVSHAHKHFLGNAILNLFTVANGQADDPKAMPIYDGCWMMTDQTVREYIGEMAEFSEVPHSDADEKISEVIRPHIYNNGWFPFAVDGFGETLCVDFQPAQHGKIGQIIKVWHDSSTKELVAQDFSEFLSVAVKTANSH